MTQDHPAVVNLALVGSDSNNTNILNEQVHSFRYDVISNETGGSHKYTIELINYDDSFMGGLIDMYATIIGSDGSLVDSAPIVAGSENSAEASFPKLVLEWGYPGQMSGVHVAQISNIQYKYTQGKERILIIEATDVTEIFELYTKNIVKTPTRKFSLEVGITEQQYLEHLPFMGLANANGAPYEFHEIIFDILRELIRVIPGVHIEQLPHPSENYGFRDIIKSLVDGFIFTDTGDDETQQRANKTKLQHLDILFEKGSQKQKRDVYIGHYANSLKKLFDYFGITFKNPGFDEEAAIANGDTFTSIATSRVLEDGSYGYATNVISEEQTVSKPDNLKDLNNALNYSDVFAFNANFDINCLDARLVEDLFYAHDQYWIQHGDGSPNPPPDLIYLFKARVTFNQMNHLAFKQGKTVNKKKAFFHVPKNDYGPSWGESRDIPFPFGNATLSGLDIEGDTRAENSEGFYYPIADILDTIEKEKLLAQQEAWDQGLSEAVLGIQEPLSAPIRQGKTYEELTETEKADLEYNNLKYYYESEQGMDVMKSAQLIIDKFNSLMPDGLKIGMMKESIRYQQSFKDIQDKVVNSTGSVPTTVIYLGSKKDLSRLSKQGLQPFNTEKSNPRADDLNTLMYTADPSTPHTLKLSYGGQGANVKYFDFASDHRYLANIITSFVSVNTFNSFSEYLSADSIKRYLSPMLTVLNNFWEVYGNEAIIDNIFKTHENASNFDNSLDTELQGKLTVMRDKFADFSNAMDTQVVNEGIIPISDTLLEIFSTEEFKMIIDFIVKDKLSTEAKGPETVMVPIANSNQSYSSAVLEDLSTRIKIFFGALSNSTYVAHLFHEAAGQLKDPDQPPEEFIAEALMNYSGSDSSDATLIEPLPAPKYEDAFVYTLHSRNPFDIAAGLKLEKNLALQADFLDRNAKDVITLKVKTLGIPEMDTYREVSAPRRIEFKIENIKNSYVTNKYQHHSHWLSGTYNPLAISHTIDSKGGYSTEFKLIKENGSYGGLSGK